MKKTGISLIEIVIVLGFISVLAVFAFVYIDPVTRIKKANDGKRKSDLFKMQIALGKYYKDNGRYPKSSMIAPLYRIVRPDGTIADWGQQWIPYISELPKDPASKNYVYFAVSNGQAYYIYASLDIGTKDQKMCKKDGSVCESALINGIPSNACGGVCNYGISSLNVSP